MSIPKVGAGQPAPKDEGKVEAQEGIANTSKAQTVAEGRLGQGSASAEASASGIGHRTSEGASGASSGFISRIWARIIPGRASSASASASAVAVSPSHGSWSLFEAVNSNRLISLGFAIPRAMVQINRAREFFLEKYEETGKGKEPVGFCVDSRLISDKQAIWLMEHKKYSDKDFRCAQGDFITNMEWLRASFVSAIAIVTTIGDYGFFEPEADATLGRQVILSVAVDLDFKDNNVFMKLAEVRDIAIIGRELPPEKDEPFYSNHNIDSIEGLQAHEESIVSDLVYQLTDNHRLPARSEIPPEKILEKGQALDRIRGLIREEGTTLLYGSLRDLYVTLNGHVLSLEILLHSYEEQFHAEFKLLEKDLPQGYVYTMDPPVIFSLALGGVTAGAQVLSKLQILALKNLKDSDRISFANMKYIAFNDSADRESLELLGVVFPGQVISKKRLFDRLQGHYVAPVGAEAAALVLHSNTDAFGEKIKAEGRYDHLGIGGNIACNSDSAVQLCRRTDWGAALIHSEDDYLLK